MLCESDGTSYKIELEFKETGRSKNWVRVEEKVCFCQGCKECFTKQKFIFCIVIKVF